MGCVVAMAMPSLTLCSCIQVELNKFRESVHCHGIASKEENLKYLQR